MEEGTENRVGNIIRNIHVVGKGYTLHLSIEAETFEGLAEALWKEARDAARNAAAIESQIRPYSWDAALDSPSETR